MTWNVNNNPVNKLTITQTTEYPFEEKVQFKLAMRHPIECSLHLRIPAWAKNSTITVNGGKVENSEAERTKTTLVSGFSELRRKWRDGDTIELALPMNLQLGPINEKHPNVCALVYGPTVLFGLSSTKPRITREQLLSAQRTGIKEWTVKTKDLDLKLVPFTAIKDEQYTTYFQFV